MAEILSLVHHLTAREMENASNYATRFCIRLRVLNHFMHVLEIRLRDLQETKHQLRVAVSCSRALETCWMEHHNQEASSDEWAIVERFLSKDFVRPVDAVKLIALFARKLPNPASLHLIFAVDGLRGPSPKHYLENLAIPTDGSEPFDDDSPLKTLHVGAVREVYRRHPQVTPDLFSQALRKLFDDGDDFEDVIKDCYLDALGDRRDAVLEWKTLEYKRSLRKLKRNVEGDPPAKKKTKRTPRKKGEADTENKKKVKEGEADTENKKD